MYNEAYWYYLKPTHLLLRRLVNFKAMATLQNTRFLKLLNCHNYGAFDDKIINWNDAIFQPSKTIILLAIVWECMYTIIYSMTIDNL